MIISLATTAPSKCIRCGAKRQNRWCTICCQSLRVPDVMMTHPVAHWGQRPVTWARSRPGVSSSRIRAHWESCSEPVSFGHCLKQACAPLLAAVLLASPGAQAQELPSTNVDRPAYEAAVKRHMTKRQRRLPSSDEAEMLLNFDRDLFTEDAWQGMRT